MTELPAYVLLVLRALLAVSLYAFLAWALGLVWQDLRRAGLQPHTRQIPPIRLVAPDHPEFTLPAAFTTPVVVIGRDAASDCCLANETVSASHARLTYARRQWWLEDLGSRNGTYLNGVTVDTPIVLTNQDSIQLGKVTILVELDDDGKDMP
ncbi:MAG: FHA domain-containing protein [Chloroflexi bacterium]|nr:FHA domain-containing protein [Chloroflexota bacterium]